jgi:hypothetical protein
MVVNVVLGFGVRRSRLLLVSLILVVLLCSLFSCTMVVGAKTSLKGAIHVSDEVELKNAVSNAKSGIQIVIAIDNDISLTEGMLVIPAGKDITLTSNKAIGFYQLIGAKAMTRDPNLFFDTYYDTVVVMGGGVLRIDGVIVTHAKGIKGTGVRVGSDGTLIMYDGKISGNNLPRAYLGHAAWTGYGGGVHNSGIFEMYGGEITNNTAYCGGGVYNVGTFTMYDGIISDNAADYGGGVYGTVDRFGGEIYNNTTKNKPYPENNSDTSENTALIFITVICVGAMVIMGVVMVLISYFKYRKISIHS